MLQNDRRKETWYGGGGPKIAVSLPSWLSLPLSNDMSSAAGACRQFPIIHRLFPPTETKKLTHFEAPNVKYVITSK